MKDDITIGSTISLLFSLVVLMVGVLNIFLVHPVPGIAYLLLSLVYAPQLNSFLMEKFGFRIPPVVKILLGIAIIMFTLGVSDLGDMVDDL